MAKEFSHAFYYSAVWRRTRKAFIESKNRVCERCGDVAEIVHHKKHLSAKNMNNPEITLDWDNLQALCRNCHAEVHMTQNCARELQFDANGNLIPKCPPS